ncbi:hypothetical protein EV424DRAFT_1341069 [Suillus variegatus]|nr:hypothetical protein EV424DRAFT_1341069 [Suillus variegatus]
MSLTLQMLFGTFKTKLLSAGTAKAYPVVTQLVNLPTNIHNEEGIGGGYIIGWLPIIMRSTRTKHTLEKKERTLKRYGLHDMNNLLWSMTHTDVHQALSYDKLHFHDGGLFNDYLWVKFQKYLNSPGREAVSQIDKRFKAFPYWHNQQHPNQVMNIAFMDSSISENIQRGELSTWLPASLVHMSVY